MFFWNRKCLKQILDRMNQQRLWKRADLWLNCQKVDGGKISIKINLIKRFEEEMVTDVLIKEKHDFPVVIITLEDSSKIKIRCTFDQLEDLLRSDGIKK